MAHWAQIDENNYVINVTVGSNEDFDEGYQWLIDNIGGTWIKTSYSGNLRRRFAGVGMKYDSELDAFIQEQPFPSWVLNRDTADWDPPVAYPLDDNDYTWNEELGDWQPIVFDSE